MIAPTNSPDQAETAPGTGTDQGSLNLRRRRAVELRIAGMPLASIQSEVNLSNPTIINAHKDFLSGGWEAVDRKPRGRAQGDVSLGGDEEAMATEILSLQAEDIEPGESLWSYRLLKLWLEKRHNKKVSLRTAGKYAERWQLAADPALPSVAAKAAAKANKKNDNTISEQAAAAKKLGKAVFSVGMKRLKNHSLLYAKDARGSFIWMAVDANANTKNISDFLSRLLNHAGKPFFAVVSHIDLHRQDDLAQWFQSNNCEYQTQQISQDSLISNSGDSVNTAAQPLPRHFDGEDSNQARTPASSTLTHLQRLEAESIHILREVIAEADKPVMLYSLGKDSAVMLHLAKKAFYPAPLPLPLLHVDTTWKFRAMYEYRDKIASDNQCELIVHSNQEGLDQGVNPITHGSALHTDILKTEALKQALNKNGFDMALAGARRDEEGSRAKERVFSFRTSQHRWDPRNQRPELWQQYNTRKQPGESIRVFPLSNWTELDIWQYIQLENIPVVPLYFAAERPVVERDGNLIMIDDDRMPLKPGEVPALRKVRFRTLGCYPLTSAVESSATTVPEIIAETFLARTSERAGRMIDHDGAASMEKKKQEGYF